MAFFRSGFHPAMTRPVAASSAAPRREDDFVGISGNTGRIIDPMLGSVPESNDGAILRWRAGERVYFDLSYPTYGVAEGWNKSVTVGDFNRDGRLDFVLLGEGLQKPENRGRVRRSLPRSAPVRTNRTGSTRRAFR